MWCPTIMIDILTSPVFNVVLTLLIIFQWLYQRAKEQAIKNNLFALRNIITKKRFHRISSNEIDSLVEQIEAVLATLEARKPYKIAMKRLIEKIHERNSLIEKQNIITELSIS